MEVSLGCVSFIKVTLLLRELSILKENAGAAVQLTAEIIMIVSFVFLRVQTKKGLQLCVL